MEAKRKKNTEKMRKWREKNPDKSKEYARKYRVKNSELVRKRDRERYASDPNRRVIAYKSRDESWLKNPDRKLKSIQRLRAYRDKYPDKVKLAAKKYRDSHREERRERQREYYKTKRATDLRKDRELRKMYGITLAEYEARLNSQEGVCDICKQPERIIRKNGKRMFLAVDHCHVTGKIRSLLCAVCNHHVGVVEKRIKDIIPYLLKHGAMG